MLPCQKDKQTLHIISCHVKPGDGPATPRLIKPAEPFEVEAALVVERDPLLFQQTLLQHVAPIAGQAIRHLALGVDDTMPGDPAVRPKALKHLADKARAPRQASHRGDLAIGRNPALWDTTDHGANRRD